MPDFVPVSSRRSLVLGAAWTAPALVVVTAVPAWAVGSASPTMTVTQTSGDARTRTGTVTLLLDSAPTTGLVLATVTYSEGATPAAVALTDSGPGTSTGELYTFDFTLDTAPTTQHDVSATITVPGYGTTVAAVSFEPAGTRDTAFTTHQGTGLNSGVYALGVQADGKIVAGGAFTSLDGAPAGRLARLNADGTADAAFATHLGTGFNNSVQALAVQADGKILAAGSFLAVNGTATRYLARLGADGSTDTTFTTNLGTGFNAPLLNALTVQADGKILVGGGFTVLNSVPTKSLARLKTDGTPDTTFTANQGTGFNTSVLALAVQADGKILAGGGFTLFNGVGTRYLARLNADGTLDRAFTTAQGSGLNGPVQAVAVQADGKILAGGSFTLNGVPTKYVARLNLDGTPDTTFTTNQGTGLNASVSAVAVQADGKILVGGNFTALNGVPTKFLARANADGTPDTTFTENQGTGLSAGVRALAASSSGVVVGGFFTTYDGAATKYLARIYT